jgi:hypothetical protein
MKYGLPYKGSKNKLAERIIELFPRRSTLVDLFCGGCAITHAAMVHNRFQHYIINDLNPMCPSFFMDVLAGKYNNERRWISREDFFRLKDTDPYVAFVWSFGNNLRDYLYSREIEPLKRAMHYAIFFSDYGPGKELGFDFSFIDDIRGRNYEYNRYIAMKRFLTTPGLTRSFERMELQQYERCRNVESINKPFDIQSEDYVEVLNNITGGGYFNCHILPAPEGLWRLQYRERHDAISILRWKPSPTTLQRNQKARTIQYKIRGGG